MAEQSSGLKKFTIVIFLITLFYSILRQHIFLGLPWADLPLSTLNKVLAWCALNYIGLALMASTYRFFADKRFQEFIYTSAFLMNTGLAVLILHALLSVMLLSSGSFEEIHLSEGNLSLSSAFGLLFGAFSLTALIFYLIRSSNTGFIFLFSDKTQKIVFPVFIFTFISIHPLFMGYSEWFQNMREAGYLPRISFLAFIDALGILTILAYLTVKINKKIKK